MSKGTAVIIAIALILGSVLFGGIYEMRVIEQGAIYKINKYTGTTWLCHPPEGCQKMK
jgi:hypothetical protein